MSEELQDFSFLNHVEALRRTLFRIFVGTLIVFPVAWYFTPRLVDWLILWCCPPELAKLYYFAPMEAFVAELKLALVVSLIAAFPYNLKQIWDFIAPGLYRHERRALLRYLAAGTFLFMVGIAFCVGAVMPIVMRFSAGFATDGLVPLIGMKDFLSLTGMMSLAFGVLFQFPLGVIFSVRLGLVRVATLRKSRPVVITVILILAAIFTPPDVFSQILVALPTWLLFELGIIIAARMEPAEVDESDSCETDVPTAVSVADEEPEFTPQPDMGEYYLRENNRGKRRPIRNSKLR